MQPFYPIQFRELMQKVDTCRKLVNKFQDPEALLFWTRWDKVLRLFIQDLVSCIGNLCKDDCHSQRSKSLIICLNRFLSVLYLLSAALKKNYTPEAMKEIQQFITKMLNSIFAKIEVSVTKSESFTGMLLDLMDFILSLIGEIKVVQGRDNMWSDYHEVNPAVEELLCFAMSVANVALGEDQKIIKGSCCSVIEAMLKLKQEITKEQPNPSMCNLVVDVVIDKLCALERNINMAVLRLSITVFSFGDNPFVNVSNHVEEDTDFASFTNEFNLYFDRLHQVCTFSIASSTESCTSIRSAMANLSFFENEFPPVFISYFKTKSKHLLEFAVFLEDFWKEELDKIEQSVYKIVEPLTYCQAVIEIIGKTMSELYKNKDSLEVNKITSVMMIAGALSRMLDLNTSSFVTDVEIKVFRIAMHELMSAVECYFRNPPGCSSDSVLKRCIILMTTIKKIIKALADCNQTTTDSVEDNTEPLNSGATNDKCLAEVDDTDKSEEAVNELTIASPKPKCETLDISTPNDSFSNTEPLNPGATNDKCLAEVDHTDKSEEAVNELTIASPKPKCETLDMSTPNDSFYENKTSLLKITFAEKRHRSFWYRKSLFQDSDKVEATKGLDQLSLG